MVGDDDAAGGFVPMAVFVEATIGANRADDVICGRRDVCGLFHDQAKAVAELAGALLEESQSVSVAVNTPAMAEIEFLGDLGGTAPVQEILLDRLAVGMLADDAANAVVVEAGGPFRSRFRNATGFVRLAANLGGGC